MNRNQRKRHFVTWWVLALLIPIGFFFALKAIPEKAPPAYAPGTLDSKPLPFVASTLEENGIRMNLRATTQNDPVSQLEVVVLGPINQPSMEVYLVGVPGPARLLGLIGTQGIYRFALPDSLVARSQYVALSNDHTHKIDIP
jgi:hypothetical protein